MAKHKEDRKPVVRRSPEELAAFYQAKAQAALDQVHAKDNRRLAVIGEELGKIAKREFDLAEKRDKLLAEKAEIEARVSG